MSSFKIKNKLFTFFLFLFIFSFGQITLAKEYTAKVVSNYDGDTITVIINGKKEKVRLLGVDTAEMGQGYWGKEAQKFTEKLTKGKTIKLETDVQERDKYGRLLAYAYVDGKSVNLELIKNGYAQLLTYSPNVRYVDQFSKAQTEARSKGKGIWGKNGLTETPYEYRHGSKKNTTQNSPGAKNNKNKVLSTEGTSKSLPDNQGLVHVNTSSGIYHSEGCRYYNCNNCTLELTEQEAISKGYRRCKSEK